MDRKFLLNREPSFYFASKYIVDGMTYQHRLHQRNVKVGCLFILLKYTENEINGYGLKRSKGMVVVIAATLSLLAFLKTCHSELSSTNLRQ